MHGELVWIRKLAELDVTFGVRFLTFSKSVSSFDLPLFFHDSSLEIILIEHLTYGNDRPSFENAAREAPE